MTEGGGTIELRIPMTPVTHSWSKKQECAYKFVQVNPGSKMGRVLYSKPQCFGLPYYMLGLLAQKSNIHNLLANWKQWRTFKTCLKLQSTVVPYNKCLELEKWWVSVNVEHGLHTKCCLIYHPPPCRSSQWLSLVIILLIAPKCWCFIRQVLPKLTMCLTCSKNRVFWNMHCMPNIRGWAHASRHMNAARQIVCCLQSSV
jgi:hypothetical protein